jgi:hypothetical protein
MRKNVNLSKELSKIKNSMIKIMAYSLTAENISKRKKEFYNDFTIPAAYFYGLVITPEGMARYYTRAAVKEVNKCIKKLEKTLNYIKTDTRYFILISDLEKIHSMCAELSHNLNVGIKSDALISKIMFTLDSVINDLEVRQL